MSYSERHMSYTLSVNASMMHPPEDFWKVCPLILRLQVELCEYTGELLPNWYLSPDDKARLNAIPAVEVSGSGDDHSEVWVARFFGRLTRPWYCRRVPEKSAYYCNVFQDLVLTHEPFTLRIRLHDDGTVGLFAITAKSRLRRKFFFPRLYLVNYLRFCAVSGVFARVDVLELQDSFCLSVRAIVPPRSKRHVFPWMTRVRVLGHFKPNDRPFKKFKSVIHEVSPAKECIIVPDPDFDAMDREENEI